MNPWPWRTTWWQRRCNSRVPRDCPKLSVITPSFNQGRFLEQTILSVLNQDYPNLEYIVIDGGSTDDSVEIIRRYEHRLAYWISEKDNGQADAINKGLKRATGEIVGWLNSDDLYLPWTFRRAVAHLAANPEAAMVCGARLMIDECSRVSGFAFLPAYSPRNREYSIAQETAFWRASVHQRIGWLDEALHFAMDVDFFVRMHFNYRIDTIPQLLGCFRCYPQNKSSTMQETARANSELIRNRYFGGRPEQEWPVARAGRAYSQLRVLLYPYTALLPMLARKLGR